MCSFDITNCVIRSHFQISIFKIEVDGKHYKLCNPFTLPNLIFKIEVDGIPHKLCRKQGSPARNQFSLMPVTVVQQLKTKN